MGEAIPSPFFFADKEIGDDESWRYGETLDMERGSLV